MTAGFLKRNEKVLMVLLLLVLAPGFAFTGIMTWYFSYAGNDPAYEVFGRIYTQQEFGEIRDRVALFKRVELVRTYGPYANVGRLGATADETFSHMMMRHEVERLGIRPAEAEKQEALREAAIDLITWKQVLDNAPADFNSAFSAFTVSREATGYNPDQYREVLRDPRFGLNMSILEFEESVLDNYRQQLLFDRVTSVAVASEKEIYEEFFDTRHLRSFEYVAIPTEPFTEVANAAIDEDYIRSVYDENPDLYRQDATVQIRAAKVNWSNLADREVQPSLEEIEARYEKDKSTRYRGLRRPNPDTGEIEEPQEEFRPLTDVFESVVRTIQDDLAKEQGDQILQAALDRAKERAAAGEEWTFEEVFGEDTRHVRFIDSDPLTRVGLNSMTGDLRNTAALAPLFFDVAGLEIGRPGDSIVTVATGNYIYKVAAVEPVRGMSFAEAIEKVTEEAQKRKAKELATEFAQGWTDQIRGEEDVTLASLAEGENYTVHENEPIGELDGYKLKIDDRGVISGNLILQQLFALGSPGEVTDPVSHETDDRVYVAVLREIVPPDMALFESNRPSVESQVLAQKRTAIIEQFRVELMTRADIRRLFEIEEEPAQ